MDVTMIFTNSSLIDFVDELTLITNEHQPFKTLISDTPFLHFFLFLQPLLFFSFSLRSMDLFFLHSKFFSFSLHSMDLFLKLTEDHFPFTHLAIEFVITLVNLFVNYIFYKRLTLPYDHISSLKGLVGLLANVFVIPLRLFLLHSLFFSFSLLSMDLLRQLRQHHFPFTHLAIEFVITLEDLFVNYIFYKLLTLPYYHISSLKDILGKLANVFVIPLVKASESAPGIMKNDLRQLVIIRLFQKRIIGWLYSIQMRLLLLEIEDDAQRISAENEDEDENENENEDEDEDEDENANEDGGEWSICKNGMGCLNRMGSELGNDTIAQVAFPQLPVYLTSPRWQERLAGLVALAEINLRRETIPDDISEQVMTVALNLFQHHPYPRVRRAAINEIFLLFYKSNSRGFQLQCCRRVLPALAGAIYEDPEQRVTSAAYKAVHYMYKHFGRSLPLSVYLCASEWQQRLVGLLGIAQIAKFRPREEILNLEHVLTNVLSLFQNPPHPADRWAAIDVIGHLSNYVGPTFQVRVQDCVFQTLRSALYGVQEIQNNFDELLLDLLQNSHRPVKSATIAAILQLSNDLDPNLPLPLPFHLFLLPALAEIMSAFQYPGDQDVAAFVMIHISTKYPIDTSPYLRVTLSTLLEVRRREDIASDQTRIHEINSFLEMFEARLPHETLTSTLDGLSPEQRVEFCAILLNEETYGE